MCGIAGIFLNDPTSTKLPPHHEREAFLNGLLKGIENRGRHATGVVAVSAGARHAHLEKADASASTFLQWRRPTPEDARTVLLHTRYATQGSPMNLDNNHPVQHKSCFVTHNGHINNDDALFKDNKFDRIAEVDSEIIPALIDKHGLDKVHLALQELLGGFAIAAIQPSQHPDILVLAKGPNSPLEYLETEQGIIWASTRGAVQDAWHEVWGKRPDYNAFKSLREGELLYIEPNKVELLQFKVKPKPYVHTTTFYGSSDSWSGRAWGADDYTSRYSNEHVHRRICKCTHSQWMHTGTNLNGMCIKGTCRCISYAQHSYMGKKEWKASNEYKRIKEDKEREAARKAADRKTRTEVREGGTGTTRILYVGGERKTFENGRIVKTEFKCDGCSDYKTTTGKVRMGGYTLCVECWGDECDGCNEFFDPQTLTKVLVDGKHGTPEDWFLCDECYNVLNTDVAGGDSSTTVVEEAQPKGVLDGLKVDSMAIKLAAEELGVKSSFLYELLFEMTEKEVAAETWLTNAYSVSISAYHKCVTELKQGLPEVTSKALKLRGVPTKAKSASVGEALTEGDAKPDESEVGVRVFMDE